MKYERTMYGVNVGITATFLVEAMFKQLYIVFMELKIHPVFGIRKFDW